MVVSVASRACGCVNESATLWLEPQTDPVSHPVTPGAAAVAISPIPAPLLRVDDAVNCLELPGPPSRSSVISTLSRLQRGCWTTILSPRLNCRDVTALTSALLAGDDHNCASCVYHGGYIRLARKVVAGVSRS